MESGDVNAGVVKVFHGAKEESVEIVMEMNGSVRTMQRNNSETLKRSLDSIAMNVKTANAKHVKKMKLAKDFPDTLLHTDEASPSVTLHNLEGEKIDGELGIIEAWEQAKSMRICDYTYRVAVNPPKIEGIKLVRMPIAGIPIYPQLQLRMASIDKSRFEWFRGLPSVQNDEARMGIDEKSDVQLGKHKIDLSGCESIEANADTFESWELIGNDITYTASEEDVGYRIRLKVYPGSERYPQDSKNGFHAEPVFVVTDNTVIRCPEPLLFTERSKHTTKRCESGSFRFVCYNVLADVYTSTEEAHSLLFSYCPDDALHIDYRQQLVLKELIGYNSDIVCLQEVDCSVFESYYMPAMSLRGYAGSFAAKEGMKEGVSLFYRRDKFRLLSVDNIILRRALREDRNSDLHCKLEASNGFLKNFMSKPTCLLVGVLQSIEDHSKKILLGNAHLFWHEREHHIRLIQIELVLREMRRLYAENSEEGCTLTRIITGDLNSNPQSAVVQLLTEGEVPSNHADWYAMGKSEYLPDMVLKNPNRFTSACGYPKYTNYVTTFQDSLDYVFVDDLVQVCKVIPQPSHEMVISHTALPNVAAPSDHIAQVVELTWKK